MLKRRCFAILCCFFILCPALSVHASALPTPPTLNLLKPQLRVMRGNAYQYALERGGYDIRAGVDALSVIGALETACGIADYAFENDDSYQATIQHVNDRSGLPDSLQGLNGELYFAKINYLDMQLGVYMDEFGNKVGNAIVQYSAQVQKTLDVAIGSIKNRVLGSAKDLDLGSLSITVPGNVNGYIGSSGYAYYKNPNAYSAYGVDYFQIVNCAPGTQFYVLTGYNGSKVGYPAHIAFITPASAPSPTFRTGWKFFNSQAESDAFSASLESQQYIFQSWDKIVNGYRVGWMPLSGVSLKPAYIRQSNVNYPFPLIDADINTFQDWAYNLYIPNLTPGGELVPGVISLNPNGLADAVAGKAYDYDSLVGHNGLLSDTVPEISPSLDPLPSNKPLYPPISLTVPQPKPAVFPEYSPIPEPEPDPDPTPKPDPDEDLPYVADLTGVFPFCIPFDVIHLFEALDAEPIAPRFEIPFSVPALNIDMDVVLDMSFLNEVAELVRTCESVGFILMFALLTPKVIKW